jgi:HPt (histidine-containing phosphotransfer) domain-containing protein
MEKAVNLNDLTSLQREIHKVKPTFAMVGLQKIGQLAGKIETQLQEVSHLSGSIQSDIIHFRRMIKEGVQLVVQKQQSITNYLK